MQQIFSILSLAAHNFDGLSYLKWNFVLTALILHNFLTKCSNSNYSHFNRSLLVFQPFSVASHLNTANSCCHHVFLRHFRFQKCLPVNNNPATLQFAIQRLVNLHTFLQIVSFFTIITLIIVLVYTFCRPDQLISYIK